MTISRPDALNTLLLIQAMTNPYTTVTLSSANQGGALSPGALIGLAAAGEALRLQMNITEQEYAEYIKQVTEEDEPWTTH